MTLVGKETASPSEDVQVAFKELSLWDITGRRRRQGPWSLNNLVASQILVASRTCNSFWCNTNSPKHLTALLNNIHFLFPDWLPVQPYIIPHVRLPWGRFCSFPLQYLLRGKYSHRWTWDSRDLWYCCLSTSATFFSRCCMCGRSQCMLKEAESHCGSKLKQALT